MDIRIKWFEGKYPSFNVGLASSDKAEEFLSIKGCKIMNGQNGEFVSWPATKNQETGKYWNHVWGSDKFAAAVLEKAKATRPQEAKQSSGAEEDIPF